MEALMSDESWMERGAVTTRWTSRGFLVLVAFTAACSSTAATEPPATPTPSLEMRPEAGYVEVPAQTRGASDRARMFYSFHPADAHPERAPLLVFFNGGPGAATSGILLPFGTGPKTLLVDDLGRGPVENRASYTRFANLLYLDERDAGFSYELGGYGPGVGCAGAANYVTDAGDFVFALLAFLDTHARLAQSRVVLVGESYGGTRAPVMLALLQRYAHLDGVRVPAEGSPGVSVSVKEEVPWLPARMQAHLDLAFPERAGEAWTPEQVALQLGWEVLIEPSFMGPPQAELQLRAEETDPIVASAIAEQRSPFDMRVSDRAHQAAAARIAHVLREPGTLEAILGVPLESIVGLDAAERGKVVREVPAGARGAIVADEHALRARLGQLGPSDAYFLRHVVPRCGGYLGDENSARLLLDGLSRTHAFITDARYDAAVYAPAIPAILGTLQDGVTVDATAPSGTARPGVIRIAPPGKAPVTIRFPPYEAGHSVTMSAAAELREDVEAWLRETNALPR
jgi:hypothetical protein